MQIAVFATNPSFVGSILEELKRHHTVETYEHFSGFEAFNVQNIRALLDWCDVAFFDFCHYPLPLVTHMKLLKCKIVARMHGHELYSDAKKIRWEKVDRLILTSPMHRKLRSILGFEVAPTVELPMGIDLNTFTLPKRKRYGKKLCLHATSIYWKKRVYSTIQMFYELLKHDDGWKLYIKGQFDSSWLGAFGRRYSQNVYELIKTLKLEKKVHFSENVQKPLWAKWLQNKDIYISNSIEEGFHVSLAEAMACGVYPVINCWYGVEDYYPRNFICYSESEMIRKILAWNVLTKREKRALSRYCHKWAKKYDETVIARKIREIIEGVCSK